MDKEKSENICYSKHFARQLNKLLSANKIKKRQLAKAIGVSEDAIYKWTSTNQRPEWIEYMCKMFVFLKDEVSDFSPMRLFIDYNFTNIKKQNREIREAKKLQKTIQQKGLNNYLEVSTFLDTTEKQNLLPLLKSQRLARLVTEIIEFNSVEQLRSLNPRERDDRMDRYEKELYSCICYAIKLKQI